MILHPWLQLRDTDRAARPWLSKRERDLAALWAVYSHWTFVGSALARMIEREARKP